MGRLCKAVHAALVEAGKNDGLTLVGGRAYSSNTLESGWLPSPLPATFTRRQPDDEGLPRMGRWRHLWRQVLDRRSATSPTRSRATTSTPWDIGYGHILKFDHDFVGREALERKAGETAQARRSRWRSTTRTCCACSRRSTPKATVRSTSSSRARCTRCTRSTRC